MNSMQEVISTATTGRKPWASETHGRLANYARTALLMSALVALLAIGGQAIGGYQGMIVFGALGLLINFGSYWFSDRIALLVHRAQPISQAEMPGLYAIVERLARRAKIPMPPLYLIPSDSPNAFATGRNPSHAAVAVTEGILRLLDERELEGVLAHELSHVRNYDVLIASIAAAIAGLIAAIGHIVRWGLLFGGLGSRDHEEGRDSIFGAIVWIVVAPIVALLIQLAISRAREYAADASGAALCGDPEALSQALYKLEHGSQVHPYEYGGPATAHLFIVNPLHGMVGSIMNLLSTHPPIEERIRRLHQMAAEGR